MQMETRPEQLRGHHNVTRLVYQLVICPKTGIVWERYVASLKAKDNYEQDFVAEHIALVFDFGTTQGPEGC